MALASRPAQYFPRRDELSNQSSAPPGDPLGRALIACAAIPASASAGSRRLRRLRRRRSTATAKTGSKPSRRPRARRAGDRRARPRRLRGRPLGLVSWQSDRSPAGRAPAVPKAPICCAVYSGSAVNATDRSRRDSEEAELELRLGADLQRRSTKPLPVAVDARPSSASPTRTPTSTSPSPPRSSRTCRRSEASPTTWHETARAPFRSRAATCLLTFFLVTPDAEARASPPACCFCDPVDAGWTPATPAAAAAQTQAAIGFAASSTCATREARAEVGLTVREPDPPRLRRPTLPSCNDLSATRSRRAEQERPAADIGPGRARTTLESPPRRRGRVLASGVDSAAAQEAEVREAQAGQEEAGEDR